MLGTSTGGSPKAGTRDRKARGRRDLPRLVDFRGTPPRRQRKAARMEVLAMFAGLAPAAAPAVRARQGRGAPRALATRCGPVARRRHPGPGSPRRPRRRPPPSPRSLSGRVIHTIPLHAGEDLHPAEDLVHLASDGERDFPEPGGPVLAAGQGGAAVGAEGHGVDEVRDAPGPVRGAGPWPRPRTGPRCPRRRSGRCGRRG